MAGSGSTLRISAANPDELRSLLDWLRREETLRGRVTPENRPVRPGELGWVLDALVVALGSGGAGAVLASSLSTWFATRRSTVDLTITGKAGHTIKLTASQVRDPEHLLREISGLLDKAAEEEP